MLMQKNWKSIPRKSLIKLKIVNQKRPWSITIQLQNRSLMNQLWTFSTSIFLIKKVHLINTIHNISLKIQTYCKSKTTNQILQMLKLMEEKPMNLHLYKKKPCRQKRKQVIWLLKMLILLRK